MMKKSTFGAALAFLAAVAGVLTAVALYLYRREKELDEYEKLLFSDEYDDDDDMEPMEDDEEPAAPGTEPAPETDGEISFCRVLLCYDALVWSGGPRARRRAAVPTCGRTLCLQNAPETPPLTALRPGVSFT